MTDKINKIGPYVLVPVKDYEVLVGAYEASDQSPAPVPMPEPVRRFIETLEAEEAVYSEDAEYVKSHTPNGEILPAGYWTPKIKASAYRDAAQEIRTALSDLNRRIRDQEARK